MGEYKFYQDRKVTSWERDYFSVKADDCLGFFITVRLDRKSVV